MHLLIFLGRQIVIWLGGSFFFLSFYFLYKLLSKANWQNKCQCLEAFSGTPAVLPGRVMSARAEVGGWILASFLG